MAYNKNVNGVGTTFLGLCRVVVLKACVRYFHQIFIFSPNDSPSKTMKNVFISSKK